MRWGQVWWIEHPAHGMRPAVILTRDEAIDVLTRVLIAPVTSTIRGIPTEVELDSTEDMPRSCAVSLDNVRVISKRRFVSRITTLGPATMQEVCLALRRATGC